MGVVGDFRRYITKEKGELEAFCSELTKHNICNSNLFCTKGNLNFITEEAEDGACKATREAQVWSNLDGGPLGQTSQVPPAKNPESGRPGS